MQRAQPVEPDRGVHLVEACVERRRIGDVDAGGVQVARVEADAEARVASSRSKIVASSSMERPIVPPVPAEFSISSHVSSVVSVSTCSIAGTTRSSPCSKPEPRCEPTWKTTASAPIAPATSIVLLSAATDFS